MKQSYSLRRKREKKEKKDSPLLPQQERCLLPPASWDTCRTTADMLDIQTSRWMII